MLRKAYDYLRVSRGLKIFRNQDDVRWHEFGEKLNSCFLFGNEMFVSIALGRAQQKFPICK
jgi:hypothetical protein